MTLIRFLEVESMDEKSKSKGLIWTITKNTSWLLFSDILTKALSFFLTILIARYLGVSDFGVYGFVLAFVGLFAFLPDFGLSTLLNREVAYDKDQAKKYLENFIVVKLIIGLFTFLIIAVIINSIDKPVNVVNLVYLGVVFILLDSYALFFRAVFRAFEKMEYEGIVRIVRNICLLSLGIFAIYQNLGIFGIIVAFVLSTALELILSLYLITKYFTKFTINLDSKFCFNCLKSASFFLISSVLMTLYFKIDITMLSILADDQKVGLYNSAYYFVILMNIIPSVFLPSIFPIFSKKHEDLSYIKKLYTRALAILVLVSVVMTLILLIFSKDIITLFYGNEYSSAVESFRILVVAGGIIIFDRIGIDLLNAIKKQKVNTFIMGICAFLNVILNLFLIPVYYETGAAIATLITEIFLLVLLMIFTYKYMDITCLFPQKAD